MAIDMQDALDQYGYVGLLVSRNPELKPTFDLAVKEGWNSARFERALADTNWWKRLSERKRAIAVQQATDPATWKASVQSKTAQVAQLAAHMGLKIDAGHWANRALENDWDEATLRYVLMNDKRTSSSFGRTDGASGEAGEVEAHVRQAYADYGMPVSGARIQQSVQQILGGTNTTGGIDNEVRSAAKKQYSQFAEEIDSGMTIRQIADPYVQTMANTLEIPGTEVGLSDNYIKQALQYRSADGKPATMPLHEFERQLKNDARWGHTKQAKDETYAVLQQVGQDWGFV